MIYINLFIFLFQSKAIDILTTVSIVDVNDTHKEQYLKKVVSSLTEENLNLRKKIKTLVQRVRRQKKKIISLKSKLLRTIKVNILFYFNNEFV